MNILVTNDDGFQSKGIVELIKIAQPFGKILVVAPDSGRSAQSSALTVVKPILYQQITVAPDIRIISTTGTPADCVKFAFSGQIDGGFEPDLVLSGINHGSNSAINIIYSGTVGAAFEGALAKKPSIGFSLCSYNPDEDFSFVRDYFSKIIKNVIENGLPDGVALNVNAPVGKIEGMKLTRQARGLWQNEFLKTSTPHGLNAYWLAGQMLNEEQEAVDTDEWAINHHFISIQPAKLDMTDYNSLKILKF
jgi:5'-nucleotidase